MQASIGRSTSTSASVKTRTFIGFQRRLLPQPASVKQGPAAPLPRPPGAGAGASSDRADEPRGRGLRGRERAPLADLLAPHRVVQPLLLEQLAVGAGLHLAPALEHVDAVGV